MKKQTHKTCLIPSSESGEGTCMFIEESAPKRITIEQLKQHTEFKSISDEEAESIIETLFQLAVLAYFFYLEQDSNQLDIAA
jgi:hypothetical protein